MKISVSLAPEDVSALDRYAATAGLPSRSAAVAHAVRLLADPELEGAYTAAWQEWDDDGETRAWEDALADGLVDAAR